MKNLYAVILAGGVGERFWPLSRKSNPKQFLDVFTGEPLLLTTADRMKGFVPDSNIIVVTNADYEKRTHNLLKSKKGARVIGEPVGKNTAPAIAAAAALIAKKDPSGVMIILSADHIITPVPVFLRSLKQAAGLAARSETLVCLGVPPAFPHTGLGYIEARGRLDTPAGPRVGRRPYRGAAGYSATAGEFSAFKVKRFVEKPDLKRARQYVKSGRHLWNCGIFIWSAATILASLKKHMPELYRLLEPVLKTSSTPEEKRALRKFYLAVEKESIDYGVLEKSDNIAVVKSPISWSDVGTWNVFKGLFKADKDGNLFRGNCIDLGSTNCMVLSEKGLTATCGLDDVFIVRSGDTVLVIKKDKTDKIKELLANIRNSNNIKTLQ